MPVRPLQVESKQRAQGALEALLRACGQQPYEYDPCSGLLRWQLDGAEGAGAAGRPAEPLGCWLDRVHPDDRLLAHAAIADAPPLALPSAAVPCFRLLEPTGALRWVEARGVRIDEGGASRCVGVLLDVTARRAAEQRLEFGARVLESLREAVAVVDAGGAIHWHNAAFALLAGMPGARLEGHGLWGFCAAPESRRIEQQQEIRDSVGRRGAWQGRIDMRAADGRVTVTDAGVSLMPGAHGDLWIHVRRDVTERVALEEAAVAAACAEQQQLGLELHDRLGQELAGTSMLVRTLRNAVLAGQAPDATLLREVEQLLQASVARCRDLAQGVSPFAIGDGGLGAALDDLVARTRRDAALEVRAGICPRSAALGGNFGYHVFRVAQLALATLLTRSGVSRVDLQVWHEEDDRVALALLADGRRVAAEGADMRMLAHRLALLGGSWEPLDAGRGRFGLIAMVPLPSTGEATLTRPALARHA